MQQHGVNSVILAMVAKIIPKRKVMRFCVNGAKEANFFNFPPSRAFLFLFMVQGYLELIGQSNYGQIKFKALFIKGEYHNFIYSSLLPETSYLLSTFESSS